MSETETPEPPSLQDQLRDLKFAAHSEVVVGLVQANDHLTLTELSDKFSDDSFAKDILATTPLRDLIGVARAQAPKNGKRKVSAAPKTEAKSKPNGAKPRKKAPPRPTSAAVAKSSNADLEAFLGGKTQGYSFKTGEYKEAAGIMQQTALKHLHASAAVAKEGEKRNTVWVVQ
jgi:hypothetical protein